MAQAAEEYGSHDKTFEIPATGTVRVVDGRGDVAARARRQRRRHLADVPDQGRAGPRLGQARRHPGPRDRRPGGLLARRRPRPRRQPHRARSTTYLADHDTDGLDCRSWRPVDAIAFTLERIRKGEDTISVTGNVLRDYLTDLFPILELGTSAKMLSVVPLINGGGLFETGAGGSAPKHVQQLVKENYLRWDSLGEFLALARQLRALRRARPATPGRRCSADTLDRATEHLPQREQVARPPGRPDRQPRLALLPGALLGRGARRPDRRRRAGRRRSPRWPTTLREQEQTIADELIAVQGSPVDIGGYYRPDPEKASAVMRPSTTFNEALAAL